MSFTLTAWIISLSGALFAGWFDWLKDKREYHSKLGSKPEENFTPDQILYQCATHRIELPNMLFSFIRHMGRPLMFFVIFKSFISSGNIDLSLKGALLLWYIGFFLYDDFIGKVHRLNWGYFGIQVLHWVFALYALGELSLMSCLCDLLMW